jgi:WD40 repeat protein
LAAGLEDEIWIWDITREVTATVLSHPGVIFDLAYNADGKWLASASSDTLVHLWDMQSLSSSATPILPAATFRHGADVLSMAFSADGKWLATGDQGGYARIWDIALGDELVRLPHALPVRSVFLAENPPYFLTFDSKHVYFWDLSVIRPIYTEDLASVICSRLMRNLRLNEWQFYFGEEPYRKACPNLP